MAVAFAFKPLRPAQSAVRKRGGSDNVASDMSRSASPLQSSASSLVMTAKSVLVVDELSFPM